MELDLYSYQRILDYIIHEDTTGVYLMMTCKWLYHNLTIRKLPRPRARWNQRWIESYLLRNLEVIELWDLHNIKTISHLRNLRKVSTYMFHLPQAEISKLDLKELKVCGNRVLTDISHMKNLKSLTLVNMFMHSKKRHSDERLLRGLTNLQNLTIVCTDAKDLNHLRQLKNLTVCYAPYLGSDGLKDLKLEKLSIGTSPVKHVKNLKRLHLHDSCEITQECLNGLNLEVLVIALNREYKFDHMNRLRELTLPRIYPQSSISGFSLRVLRVDECPGIVSVNHMVALEELSACGACGIGDGGIEKVNLKILRCDDNPGITNVNRMDRLERLSARGRSGIGNEGIKGVNLAWLDITGNRKVTEYGHMARLAMVVV